MNVVELLTECQSLGIQLTIADGDTIRFVDQLGRLTPELVEQLKLHKATILRLPCCPWCCSVTLVDGPSGLWCNACGRIAWWQRDNGDVVSARHAGRMWPSFDPMRPWEADCQPQRDPNADSHDDSAGPACSHCGSRKMTDIQLNHQPHDGATTRRDCARCGRFIDFTRWCERGRN